MILALTFQHLTLDERKRWLAVLRGNSSEACEIELTLVYDNREQVLGKKRGQYPERIRMVKFDAPIKKSSDVVMLWENAMTLVVQNGKMSLKQDDSVKDLKNFLSVSEEAGQICLQFKLSTNITSKSHDNSSFRFVSEARRGSNLNSMSHSISGESFEFELVAKHRSEPATAKKEQAPQAAPRAAPARTSSRQPPRPRVSTVVPQITVSTVTDGARQGSTFACMGSHVSDAGVTAELTLEAPMQRSGKRKRGSHSTQVLTLSRDTKLSQNGKFVSTLPLDLEAGSYRLRMVSSSSDELRDSEELPFLVLPAPEADTQTEPSEEPSEEPADDRDHVSAKALGVDLRMQYSASWPESKSLPAENLFRDESSEDLAKSKKSTDMLGSDLVPSNSEFALSYVPSGIQGEGAGFLGLTRSVSDEDLAKMKLNNTLFEQRGLIRTESDVDVMTRGLWLNGPNVEETETSIDFVADDAAQGECSMERHPSTDSDGLRRQLSTRSAGLRRQNSTLIKTFVK